MKWSWYYVAQHIIEPVYGGYVDWEEEFFECPECGEPIYESEWVGWWPWKRCPICDFDFFEEEE